MTVRALSRKLCVGLAAAALLFASGAQAQEPATPSDPLEFRFAEGRFKLNLETGVQAVGEANAFWMLSRVFAPNIPYKSDVFWGEAYAKPGFVFERRLSASVLLHGGASLVAAYTAGRDVFASRDTGRVLLENAYAGVKLGAPGQGAFAELSAGAQPYRIGSGMLIADGGQDGFERGALIFGPRSAWAMTALAKLGHGAFSAEAFYLDANEYASNDTKTRLAGVNLLYAPDKQRQVGLALGKVLTSLAPYPQAAAGGNGLPVILADARKGLAFANLYGRWSPLAALPGLWVAGDLALQGNDRIDMRAWGARLEIGHAFASLPFAPTLSYAWQTFSGDKPGTARLERFDPLFYDGSPNGWATGTNGSFVFINSNVNAHKLTLVLTPTPRDFVTLRYAHVRANELHSPVQFGQATRLAFPNGVPSLITGVNKAHLSDDLLAEYTRVLTPNAYLTLGLAYSQPGAGLKDLAPGQLKGWTGGFANLVLRY